MVRGIGGERSPPGCDKPSPGPLPKRDLKPFYCHGFSEASPAVRSGAGIVKGGTIEMSVIDDLKAAFAGESQANRKYLAFGEKAAKEGLPGVAKLFRAVAAAETIHAHKHLNAMDGVKSTLENLTEAQGGEQYEFTEMYPPMLANAKAEGNKRAEMAFHAAFEVEKIHYELYGKAIEAVKAGKDLEVPAAKVCPVCGHTVIGDAPDACPICGCKGEKYLTVE